MEAAGCCMACMHGCTWVGRPQEVCFALCGKNARGRFVISRAQGLLWLGEGMGAAESRGGKARSWGAAMAVDPCLQSRRHRAEGAKPTQTISAAHCTLPITLLSCTWCFGGQFLHQRAQIASSKLVSLEA